MPDYSKTKVYKLVLKGGDELNDVYIGSTTRLLCERMGGHRKDAREGEKQCNVYKWMREVGVSNVAIVLLESCPCNSFEEQRQHERRWVETLNPSLNMICPYRCREERLHLDRERMKKKWRNLSNERREQLNNVKRERYNTDVAFRQLILDDCKRYRESNAEAVSIRKKAYYSKPEAKENKARNDKLYYETHKESIALTKKVYAKRNKEHIADYKHKWYLANKDCIIAKRDAHNARRRAARAAKKNLTSNIDGPRT